MSGVFPVWADMRERLAASRFRSRFHLSARDRNYLAARSEAEIFAQAQKFLSERLGEPFPRNDGSQTPMRGHPVFIAQHATALCCRSCMEKWYHIPQGRALSGEEIAGAAAIILDYLRAEFPQWRECPVTPELFPDAF